MKHLKAISKKPARADILDVIDIPFLIDALTALAALIDAIGGLNVDKSNKDSIFDRV